MKDPDDWFGDEMPEIPDVVDVDSPGWEWEWPCIVIGIVGFICLLFYAAAGVLWYG
jgi:hypothetical protein